MSLALVALLAGQTATPVDSEQRASIWFICPTQYAQQLVAARLDVARHCARVLSELVASGALTGEEAAA